MNHPGLPPDAAPRPPRLFRTWHAALATVFGGPLAGGAILALNHRRRGGSIAGSLGLVLIGVAGTLVFVAVRWTTVWLWWVPLHLVTVLAMYGLSVALQRAALAAHAARGGAFVPGANAFVIGLAIPVTAVGAIACLFLGIALRGPGLWRQLMMVQPRVVAGARRICPTVWSTAPCDHTGALGYCQSASATMWWFPSSGVSSRQDVKAMCEATGRELGDP